PWNEFDEQYVGDFLPTFKMDWDLDEIAQLMVEKYRYNVDVMVMISHLGIGADHAIAEDVDGIDVVLGGHTHEGASISDDSNNTLVIQPNFNANGVTQLDIQYNLQSSTIAGYSYKEQLVSELTATDSEVDTAISNILAQYAPQADTAIAVVENTVTRAQVPQIAGLAGMYTHQTDAALLDPQLARTLGKWDVGDVSPQQLNHVYQIERQRSNTPGITAMYVADVSGDTLTKMIQQQPLWSYQGPVAPDSSQDYKVLLHKASALNPLVLFGEGVDYKSVAFASESYWALEQYAHNRTSECKYFDSETALQSCQREQMRSVWTFIDSENPFKTDKGPGVLSYRDPDQTGWGKENTQFKTTTELGLPDLPDGPTRVMSFAKTAINQGYTIKHNVPTNGDFAGEGLVSDYTIVMDILWPSTSDDKWRSMLQTTLDNSDEGEWFTQKKP
ncbi:MAG: metallophosphatase, partial [Psychrosphaera sp.]|nr:metallophosphatase [Psychrosphaera sp.]